MYFDPLISSGREYEIENFLKDKGVKDACVFTLTLVNIVYNIQELSDLA